MDIGDMKPTSSFFKMRLLVLLLIGGASVLASRQQLHEEPSLQLNNRVPRKLDTTDDDATENEAFKAPYSDRIIKLIAELKEEIDKHLVREQGIDAMTTIFETLIKSGSEDKWSSKESTELDSDDYKNTVNFGHNVTNEIITDVSKLLNKYGPKNLHVNWVLSIIQDTLHSAFDVSPTDLPCYEKNIENLKNEVKAAYPLYLFDSECRGTLSEYMREPNRNKKSIVHVPKNDGKNNYNRFKRSPKSSILGKQYKTKAATLINDLQDDDVFLNEFFEIGLYLNDQSHPSESNENFNELDQNVENNMNVDLILHNCEQIASEQFLIAIESAVLKFLLHPTCQSFDGTGDTGKRSIKNFLVDGIKDHFEFNSLSKIREKIAALNLSTSKKMIYLPIVEQILQAFYVKLPPVMKKVLDEIKPQFKKLNFNAQDTDENAEMGFIDMTKHRSVRDNNIKKAILDVILDHIMRPDQVTDPKGLFSVHNTTESMTKHRSVRDNGSNRHSNVLNDLDNIIKAILDVILDHIMRPDQVTDPNTDTKFLDMTKHRSVRDKGSNPHSNILNDLHNIIKAILDIILDHIMRPDQVTDPNTDTEFLDLTKHKSVRDKGSSRHSNVLNDLDNIIKAILNVILDQIMRPDQVTDPKGLFSVHNSTESKPELNSPWDVINRRIQKNVT